MSEDKIAQETVVQSRFHGKRHRVDYFRGIDAE